MGGIDDSLYTITSFQEAIHGTYHYCSTKTGGEGVLFDNVKALCDKRGITVWRLEKDLGFPNGGIRKWNESDPGIRKVQKVAEYLEVSIEELLKEAREGR